MAEHYMNAFAAEAASAASAAQPVSAEPAGRHYMRDLPAALEPQQLKASTPEELAAALYPEKPIAEVEVPEHIQELRKADPLRAMYTPEKHFGDVINERVMFPEVEGAPQIAPEVRAAVVREMANIAADVGMTNADVRTFTTIGAMCKEAPTPEQRAQWHAQTIDQLKRTYGRDAAQALQDAQTIAMRDPRLVKMLEAKGMGDHPDAVMVFARLGRQARLAGKLK